MCPLVLELKKRDGIQCVVCLTGQHREMLWQVTEVFQVRENYNLDIMEQGQSLSSITTKVLQGFGEILEREWPDLVLVHGDTTTSFAAALAAFYRQIPVGHVEAGLRTYNLYAPFPEEFNRQSVDMVSSVYFAPTRKAEENLLSEGKRAGDIYVTGNTVIDALRHTVNRNYEDENLNWAGDGRMLLLTSHRRENIGESMKNIFRAVRRAVEETPDVRVVFPVHKNPEIRETAEKYLSGTDRIRMIEPLDVVAFHNYMAKSFLILTDSGGIQEEAPSLGVPVLILRNVTERPEGVEAGVLKLAGTEEADVYGILMRMLQGGEEYRRMSRSVNPYGDGRASERIANIIVNREWRGRQCRKYQ